MLATGGLGIKAFIIPDAETEDDNVFMGKGKIPGLICGIIAVLM